MKRFLKLICFIFITTSFLFAEEKISYIDKVFNAGNGIKISVLIDGRQNRDASILRGDKTLLKKIPEKFSMLSDRVIVLLEYKNEKILFDTGLGSANGGTLLKALDEIKIKPSDITAVIITHMHMDHIGGLTLGIESVFKNASVYVPKKEFDYWKKTIESQIKEKPKENETRTYRNALTIFSVLEKDKKNIVYFNSGDDIVFLEGKDKLIIQSENAFGHTPGHTIYKIKNSRIEFMVLGDILHVIDIQLNMPDIYATYDIDSKLASDTRKRIFEYAAKNNVITVFSHTEKPGVFTIEKKQNGYIKKSF